MTSSIQTVSFHGQQLAVISQQEKLFVAIKPICENIGVQWHAQRKRIHRDTVLSQGASMMDSPSKGGDQQMLCLPLDMLNGWLFGIDDSRIKNTEIKERVIQYKRECYQVLFDYWTKGTATNPRKATPKTKPGQLTADQQTSIKELVKARVEALPQNRRAKAAITCWSALKSKFGCTYKLIAPEHFTEAVSLVARLPLEGELLAADPVPAPAAGVTLDDYELQAMMLMRLHFQHVYRIFKEHDMYDALKALGSPIGVKMIDHFKDGLSQAGMLRRLEGEWQQARIRFGLPVVEAKYLHS